MNSTERKAAAKQAIRIARDNQGANDSAKLAADDAAYLCKAGDNISAVSRALTSLFHSVGIFHPDYIKVQALDIEVKSR